MSSHEQFFARIAEDSEGGSAQAIYADWLEEQNDPRSELIRVHLKLTPLPTRHPEFKSLLKRKQSLCAGCETEWLEASGVLSRSTLLDAVAETLWDFRGYEKYGSKQKALKSLSRRRGCTGYNDDVIAEEFSKAMAVWDDMEELWNVIPSIHRLQQTEFDVFLDRMKTQLTRKHSNKQRAIDSAVGWVYMNYVR